MSATDIPTTSLPQDPRAVARTAHLRYVSDTRPGIRREADSSGTFRYIGPDGCPITEERTLTRIAALAIPPAYTDVWICPYPNGHLQATGRDARGRKQYRYHERWRSVRDATKYDRMIAFGEALPKLRAEVQSDLKRPGLPREKVLAALVRLLEMTRIRIGNAEYVTQNQSFGLTTLRNNHVEVDGATVRFRFRGKSGKEHEVDISDRRLARIVRRCQELPEQELFEYIDKDTGERRDVTSSDVNDYLREHLGGEFTAKDFRTWAGTILCARMLLAEELPSGITERNRFITGVVKQVAAQLGNTPAVCRKCYIHPGVLSAGIEGTLPACLAFSSVGSQTDDAVALSPDEEAVLAFLRDLSATTPSG